jgi:hypothetical protein
MKTKKKKNRLRRVLGITGIVLGAVILLGAGTVFLYTNHLLGKIHFVDGSEAAAVTASPALALETPDSEEPDTSQRIRNSLRSTR